MQQVMSYKNELEILIDEQTTNISVSSKRVITMEDALKHKDSEVEQKDGVIRRLTDSQAEIKKKLMQAEVKIRQLTQATIKDLKLKLKQKTNEIDVLKEMVKSTSNSLKAKDVDNQRLNKRIQRLEKLVEVNKNFEGANTRQQHRNDYDYGDEREEFEDTQDFPKMGGFGITEQVNQELLQHQMAGNKQKGGNQGFPSK